YILPLSAHPHPRAPHPFPTRRSSDLAIRDPRTNAAVIATRRDSHARLVCEALRSGKHVFVEEPLAIAQAEIDQVQETWAALPDRSEEHTSELQSPYDLVCRLLLEKKK